MNVITGTVKNGQVVLDNPEELREGTRVKVVPTNGNPILRASEEEPMSEEEIKAVIAVMDQLEPGWLSPEEEAAWMAALRDQKEQEKARFFDDAEKLRRTWE